MSDATASARRIRAQASPHDAATLRFVLEDEVQSGQEATFETGDGTDAPLARALFALEGVQRIHVAGDTIQVTRSGAADWTNLKPRIARAIRAVLDSGEAPLGTQARAGSAAPGDAELLTAVQTLLDRQANPAIAAHGGHVSAESVTDGVAYLRMSGGCQGCAASAATLREGIETMLRAALSDLRDIVDVTDHEAGTTPFYTSDGGRSPALVRPVPESAVHWAGEDLRIDPDYLSRRLGLTPEVVVAGLETGDIRREVTQGDGSPGAVTRITIRTPVRAWAAEVHPDGTLYETPPPRDPAKGTASAGRRLADRVRRHLDRLGPAEVPVTYGRLARALGLFLPGSVRKVTDALETTMHEDAAAHRPFVAALVVTRGTGLPGKGFFDLAEGLGLPLDPDPGAMRAYRDAVLAARSANADPAPGRRAG